MVKNMFFIVDSSFLILLYELNYLDLINKMMEICHNFIVTKQVFNELKRGNEIMALIGNGKFHKNIEPDEKSWKKTSFRFPQLGSGETSVLSVSRDCKSSEKVCLLDNKHARDAADLLHQDKHGTVWFIEECYKARIISKDEALIILRNIRNHSFWLDKKILIDAITRISREK